MTGESRHADGERAAASSPDGPTLSVRDLQVHFPITSGFLIRRQTGAVKAVDGVTFDIAPGETLGLVGESGSGKTTTGRAILQLQRPTAGSVEFRGVELTSISAKKMRPFRSEMQIIFQDPYGSLNPRMSAGRIIGEPLTVHGLGGDQDQRLERVAELLKRVGMNPAMMGRYPHEFSGGQRQRIGIARALAGAPSFIVCDEPVSALDVSIQAQILNLLSDLQTEFNISYLFIAHDLSVVRHISDRVAVMYLGKIMEMATSVELYENPMHPYTRALMSAVPIPDPALERQRERIVLAGDIPSPINPPSGCVFRTRCPIATDECGEVLPDLVDHGGGHQVACIKV
ncbi:MAG TPA: peptide ABC transporter substrate-binding protein [Dehalococcoidia bacterium]|nr:peptide ABC transporter substrate-binding protein [Chloroflexota bacterium]HCV28538.1 peptide ABC transporter substrate-binding protein [Dehalococcoidia bacterium]